MLILPLLFACQSKLFTIEISEKAKTTVEAGTLLEDLLGDLGFDDFVTMDVTEAEELKNQGVEPGDIQEVTLTSFTLTATAPDGADLSFLDEMSVAVSAPDLDEVRIAHADDFPEGEPKVSFTLDDVDLTAYVVSQSLTITTDVTAHRPEQDTDVTAAFTLDVGVTAQGVKNQAGSR